MSDPVLTHSTPSGRVRRTILQSLVGTCLALPTIVSGEHVTLVHAAKYGGTAVFCVLLAAVVQNFAESQGWWKSD